MAQDELADSLAMNEALAWLGEKVDDPLDELVPLRRHLRAVLVMELQPPVLLRILDLFEPRIARVHKSVFPLLLDAATPLPKNLRVISQGLIDLHGNLAAGFLKVNQTAVGEGFQLPKRRRDTLAVRTLGSLRRQYELSLRIASGPPPGFWKHVGALLLTDQEGTESHLDTPARHALQTMLAIHAAQAEALTPREQEFLWRHAETLAPQVELTNSLPKPTTTWLWLDTKDERAPTPASRRAPPTADGLVYYTCRQLGAATQNALNELAAGRLPRDLDDKAVLPDNRNVLAQAARRWLNPPPRRHDRRRGNYRVEVCPRLSSLWSLLRGDLSERAAHPLINEWQVINDSPAGYAAMHVAGEIPNLLPGAVIGVRRSPKEPWSLCLVRWVRSDNSEHLEAGLEVLSPRAQAVRIGVASRPDAPVPALLLPPMNGTHRGETLLTERGVYENGRIALIHEEAGKFQVVECQPQPLVVQTSSIELFEFQRVQHPLQPGATRN